MTTRAPETLMLIVEPDVVVARREVKAWAVAIGFGLVDQTKLVTACSELARNTIIYGGGGTVTLHELEMAGKRGLQLVFEDRGPGIDDIDLALTDGYTTGGGLGLGLSGARRLSNAFDLVTSPEGTRITIARWK